MYLNNNIEGSKSCTSYQSRFIRTLPDLSQLDYSKHKKHRRKKIKEWSVTIRVRIFYPYHYHMEDKFNDVSKAMYVAISEEKKKIAESRIKRNVMDSCTER